MKLQEKKYYNVYEVKRNKDGKIIDLMIDYKVLETTRKESKSFINNLNDSKLIIDLDDIKTYFYDSKEGRKEKANFIDYDIEKTPYYVILDNVSGILRETPNKDAFIEAVNDLLEDYDGENIRFNYYNNNTIVSIRRA